MTYTFDPSLQTNVSLVRFHIGDNHSEGHYLEDETIQFLVTTYGLQDAVLHCLRYIITQLSQPNFVQDWLEVTNEKAREGFENILKSKEREFGKSSAIASASFSLPTRADNEQTTNDYSETPT